MKGKQTSRCIEVIFCTDKEKRETTKNALLLLLKRNIQKEKTILVK